MVEALLQPLNIFLFGLGGGFLIPLLYRIAKPLPAVAFVVSRSGHDIDTDEVDAHCRKMMASFKRPRRLFVVDSLPKTATGKVQRYALRARLESEG